MLLPDAKGTRAVTYMGNQTYVSLPVETFIDRFTEYIGQQIVVVVRHDLGDPSSFTNVIADNDRYLAGRRDRCASNTDEVWECSPEMMERSNTVVSRLFDGFPTLAAFLGGENVPEIYPALHQLWYPAEFEDLPKK